jgi:hypothetical protein
VRKHAVPAFAHGLPCWLLLRMNMLYGFTRYVASAHPLHDACSLRACIIGCTTTLVRCAAVLQVQPTTAFQRHQTGRTCSSCLEDPQVRQKPLTFSTGCLSLHSMRQMTVSLDFIAHVGHACREPLSPAGVCKLPRPAA